MNTISEAKEYLRDNYIKGCKCPCCGQFVKLYKRKLNSGMAYTLIMMYKSSQSWINVKDFLRQNKLRNNHDWTLLRYWGLIIERKTEPTNGAKSVGEWMITPRGIDFISNQIRVEKRIYLYDNIFRGYDDETTNIIEALGNHFNYKELMQT